MRFQTEEGAEAEETIGDETDNGKALLHSRGAPPDPDTDEGSAEAVNRIGEAMRATRPGWDGIKTKVLEN